MSKKVNQFNTNGEFINSYKTLAEAAKSVGVSKETLSMVCNGKRKSSRGYLWSFEDSVDIKTIENQKEWKDIKGFKGKYQISSDREVRRLPFEIIQKSSDGKEYVRHFKGGIIKQWIDTEGYLAVALDGDSYRIHWLYYNTFIGDSTGYVIDHIDRNRLNNDQSNLRLLTYDLSNRNRTLAYKPEIVDCNKYYQKKHNGSMSKPFRLRFTEDGIRKEFYFNTYEEAENKYRELYNERQKRIDDSSKILTINS